MVSFIRKNFARLKKYSIKHLLPDPPEKSSQYWSLWTISKTLEIFKLKKAEFELASFESPSKAEANIWNLGGHQGSGIRIIDH